MKGELIDITAEIKVETDNAYKLDDGRTIEWVPKSQCQDNGDGSFTMPVRVALEKGFC